MHHLRRVRRAVPGRHRARRPHRRHAPLPGAGRVELPGRGRRHAAQPGEQGQPVGRWPTRRDDWTKGLDFDGAAGIAGQRCRRGHRLPVLGRLRRRVRRRRARRPRRAVADPAARRRVSSSRSSATAETCTGDPARRMGNEFLYQMLGLQNVETLNSIARDRADEDRRHLPALLQHPRQRIPATRRALRGGPPHAAARPARRGRAGSPRSTRSTERHLPRPVLPRPAQQGVRPAARGARRVPALEIPGDAPLQGPRLLLRRRRRAVLDGGEDRQAGQRRAHRRGARPRPGSRSRPRAPSAW